VVSGLTPEKLNYFYRPIRRRRKKNKLFMNKRHRFHFFQEVQMHLSEVIWWIYTALITLAAIFFLVFAFLVKEKGK
jgi:hypothetical protein